MCRRYESRSCTQHTHNNNTRKSKTYRVDMRDTVTSAGCDWRSRALPALKISSCALLQNPFLNLPALGSIGRDTAQKTYKDGDIVHTNMTYEDETESNDLSFWQHPLFQILLVVLVVQAI